MMHKFPRGILSVLIATVLGLLLVGCLSHTEKPGTPLVRDGDEISVCGQLFHTGTRVVLWDDPHGYSAYSVYKRFAPFALSSWEATTNPIAFMGAVDATNPATMPAPWPKDYSPNRFGYRLKGLTPDQITEIRGGWPLPMLQKRVDQFVIHYDVAGTSRTCFKVLQDYRDLSVHFMLDLDGTIYQTLDLQERAWHATKANDRSIGIEIANMGDSPMSVLKKWYKRDSTGHLRITIPPEYGNGGLLHPNMVLRPARDYLVVGKVQGRIQRQYDYTPQQYRALIHLTAALCTVFPRIKCDYPRDAQGHLINHVLTQKQWENFHGILGHYHVQLDKSDPGPAFQWNRVIDGARALMNKGDADRLD